MGGRPKANTKISGGWFEPVSTFWSFFWSRYIFLVRLFQIFFPNPTPLFVVRSFFKSDCFQISLLGTNEGRSGLEKKTWGNRNFDKTICLQDFFCSSDQASFASRLGSISLWVAALVPDVACSVFIWEKTFSTYPSNLAFIWDKCPLTMCLLLMEPL